MSKHAPIKNYCNGNANIMLKTTRFEPESFLSDLRDELIKQFSTSYGFRIIDTEVEIFLLSLE